MFNIKEWLGLSFYTSPLDRFLNLFRKTHPTLSASQLAEQEKYANIFQLRDHTSTTPKQKPFWIKF